MTYSHGQAVGAWGLDGCRAFFTCILLVLGSRRLRRSNLPASTACSKHTGTVPQKRTDEDRLAADTSDLESKDVKGNSKGSGTPVEIIISALY